MNRDIEIFCAGFNRNRQLWTHSSLSVATYDEYRGILYVLFENIYHDYPDLDKDRFIHDVTQLIKDLKLTENFEAHKKDKKNHE